MQQYKHKLDTKLMQALSASSLLIIVSLVMTEAPKYLGAYDLHVQTQMSRASLAAGVEIERADAEAQAEVAKLHQENAIANTEAGVILSGYTYQKGQPPQDLSWLRSTPRDKWVPIFDQHRVCIGAANDEQFYPIDYNPEICKQVMMQ